MILVRLDSCPSTNDEAKRLARGGAAAGVAVVAGAQTAGRGTRGRVWQSPRGLGLYLSVILRPPIADLAGLPLRAARAVQDAVEETVGVRAAVEPPNDIVWDGRKLGGVLCESGFEGARLEFAIVGVGLNVNQTAADFPPDIADTAVSLRMATGRILAPDALIDPIRTRILII
ncbi:MAG: biotin--[acetyl-CoA-carboxylase] ligase [Candidatus Aminicenantes bacterium]|nr:biotin--[acetyl-CoA-carboxylase] ligase [Candidatus Aminicenantes bacterium]